MLTVFLPAHNESKTIAQAIEGLRSQTLPPDNIVVVCDNCSDDTASIAAGLGVDVFETTGNLHKKAGALNQAFDGYLPFMKEMDLVLVQDADSILDNSFIENAVPYVESKQYGAVGGVFRGEGGCGFVGHFQRNEYIRYARGVKNLGGLCLVVTGTAALFRVGVLRDISDARMDGRLPGKENRKMPAKLTDEEREVYFWSKHVRDEATGCLNWQGRKHADGYGEFDIPFRRGRNRAELAHRLSWMYTFGSIPDGLHVLHRCDNPSCGEPTHLFLGTHLDNMRDMVSKGRKPSRRGERNGRAKLTQTDVDFIRASFTGKRGEKASLGRKYGVSTTTISGILSGKLWPKDREVSSVSHGVYDIEVLTEG